VAATEGLDRREALANWLTAPSNPYFTRAIVNRVWAAFFGVGIVNAVDDLRASNPASNAPLLEALCDFLIKERYDLKALMRLLMQSATYQRSSDSSPGNKDDSRYFARYYPRRLSAEVLSDSISAVTGVPEQFTEIQMQDGSTEKTTFYPKGFRAIQLYDSAVKSYFLKTFGRNQREITCECERSTQPSVVQALHLSNGTTLNDKLAAQQGAVSDIVSCPKPEHEIIEEAFLKCLNRMPKEKEAQSYEDMLSKTDPIDRRAAVEDLYWALLTSREYLFQH
jgi:hypothetical protein